MEDYKKATRDDAKWWRYGLIAATLFLVAAAYWNMHLQNVITARDAQVAAMSQKLTDQANALGMLVEGGVQRGDMLANGKRFGSVLVDPQKETAVLIVPKGTPFAGKNLQVTTADGVKRVFRTVAIEVEAQTGGAVAADFSQILFYKPDEPRSAGMSQ